MVELFSFISLLLTLYIYILVAAAVMSWLIAFNVVNTSNRFVYSVAETLYRLTEPALRPIGLACLRHPFAPARRQVSPFDSERMQRISFSSVDEIDRIEAADNYV